MSKYILTVVDTIGIQTYLFSTNNLRQNSGASFLVDQATRKWVEEAISTSAHNINDLSDWQEPLNDKQIDTHDLDAEIIYAGGGNTVILFKNMELAKAFTQRLTKKTLLNAPNLQVLVVHQDDIVLSSNDDKKALGGEEGALAKLLEKLADKKKSRATTYSSLGLSVTADCVFTDRPVVAYGKGNRAISAESKAKEQAEELVYDQLVKLLLTHNPGVETAELYDIPRGFDELGGTHGESRYVAVCHIDGNGMGKRIKEIRDDHQKASQNRDYIAALRAFSNSVRKESIESLQETVAHLVDQIEIDQTKKKATIGGKDELHFDKKSRKYSIPFRPIVFGGDDLTAVCDGRIGLTLAHGHIERQAKKVLTDDEKLYCRAGVAVVHSHYPFARAYELSESLCQSAKDAIKEWKTEEKISEDEGVTVIDWHFAVSGLIRDLADLRQREYQVESGNLLMRPIRISQPKADWRAWKNFREIVQEFQSPDWRERHNKVIALRSELRKGPDSVDHFRSAFQVKKLPEIPTEFDMMSTGWQDGRCGYFDAIEAIDFFIDLPDGSVPTDNSQPANPQEVVA